MPFSATQYDIQRLENVLAYERAREQIEADHSGRWVAIAGGEIVAVADSALDCIEQANRQTPEALHRFVFQVGASLPEVVVRQVQDAECKDLEQCGRNLINKIALGKLLRKAGGKLEDDYDKDRTCISVKDKTRCWKWQRKGGNPDFEENGAYSFLPCIEITIDDLLTKKTKKICALLDSGKSGSFMVLDAESFLEFGGGAEDPDDTDNAQTPSGPVPIRRGFVSVEIPEVGFAVPVALVATYKNRLKELVEKKKKGEQGKPGGKPSDAEPKEPEDTTKSVDEDEKEKEKKKDKDKKDKDKKPKESSTDEPDLTPMVPKGEPVPIPPFDEPIEGPGKKPKKKPKKK